MPDRMVSEAPPSLDADTISATCREWELVNTLVNSGITAAASVPHEMMTGSVSHRLPPSEPSIQRDAANDTTIDRIEHTHTRPVSGASKLILSLCAFWERATAPFTR